MMVTRPIHSDSNNRKPNHNLHLYWNPHAHIKVFYQGNTFNIYRNLDAELFKMQPVCIPKVSNTDVLSHPSMCHPDAKLSTSQEGLKLGLSGG